MKVKQRPEDFQVFEELGYSLDEGGRFGLYELRKRRLSTLEAIELVASALHVRRADIGVAGLKDRQAESVQVVSIPGPPREFVSDRVALRPLGRSEAPVSSGLGLRNRFHIVLRDLSHDEARSLLSRLDAVRRGFVNYFDDQRFGCLRHGQGFVARSLVRGDAEAALRALIAVPSEATRGGDAGAKRFIARHFGKWDAVDLAKLPAAWAACVAWLKRHPDDLAGGVVRIERRLLLIHLYAYQSFIWNETVRRFVERCPGLDAARVAYEAGTLALPREVAEEWIETSVPLVGPEGEAPQGAVGEALAGAMKAEGLTRDRLSLGAFPGLFFKDEPRPLAVRPDGLKASSGDDRLNPGRRRITLDFALRSGAYATMLIRSLCAFSGLAEVSTPRAFPRTRSRGTCRR